MTTKAASPEQTVDDDSCLDMLQDAAEDQRGILQVQLDTAVEQFAFDYDPQQTSAGEVEALIEAISPALRRRWDRCTLRLEREGGRACESCALALENQLQQVAGVRRATASYRAGVVTIHDDDAVTTAGQLRRQVQELGVALRTEEPEPGRSGVWGWLRAWLNTGQAEIVATAVTLVGLVVGFVAERLGVAWVPAVAYTVAYVAGGYYGLLAGLQSLRRRSIDVDLLMILAAVGAALVGAPFEGAMLLFLFSLSNVLQNLALDRTRNAIRGLMKLRPDEAIVWRGEEQVRLPIEAVRLGDVMALRPGDRLALDGVVVEGRSSLDQSAITGESIPVEKGVGDAALAGSINQDGALSVRVTRLAQDSTIARLIRLVEEAQSEKARTQRLIDVVEQYYAMGVIAMTLLAVVIPLLFLGEPFDTAFYRAMTLMVAASPCALVISTPATVLSAIGNGARRGVLFKGGVYVEQAAALKVIAFDKTGTLTVGRPTVTSVSVLPNAGIDEDGLLRLAAAVEAKSEHPLARAIVGAARHRGLEIPETEAFRSATGRGVEGRVDGRHVVVGNRRFLGGAGEAEWGAIDATLERYQEQGQTTVVVAEWSNGQARALGVIAVADVLRPDAPAIVRDLKALGVRRVVMLTGDNERVAQAIGRQVGADEVHAGLLPEDKLTVLKELRRLYGPVGMVGDGVNDAPALAAADVGIAMGAAGTDVALETADVVLMADDLANIPYAIALSRETRKRLWQNLGLAMAVIVGLIVSVLGFELALPLSVVGHEGSTVLVSLNGLRLLRFRRR